MDPDYFDEFIFGRIAAHAGLPNVRFHDLRHFFASMLIAQGESAKYVCDQMGHSSIQVTFDTYGHLFPNSRETAAKKLQQAMFTGRKNGFGSSLVAKPGKRGKKKRRGKTKSDAISLVCGGDKCREVLVAGEGFEPSTFGL